MARIPTAEQLTAMWEMMLQQLKTLELQKPFNTSQLSEAWQRILETGRLTTAGISFPTQDEIEKEPFLETKEVDVESQEKAPTKEWGSMSQEPARYRHLDGLRGIAALGVFHHHLLGENDLPENPEAGADTAMKALFAPVKRILKGGIAGVAIFFVLSGLVLSQTTLEAFATHGMKQSRLNLIAATIRRPLRLYMPCLLIALILALMMHLPNDVYPDAMWHPRQDTLWHELDYFVKHSKKFFSPFYKTKWPHLYEYNPVMWTIPIEVKGSWLVYGMLAVLTFMPLNKVYMAGFVTATTVIMLHFAWWWQACFVAGVGIAVVCPGTAQQTSFVSLGRMRPSLRSIFVYGVFLLGFFLLGQPWYDYHPELAERTPGWGWLTRHIPSSYHSTNYYRFWQTYGSILMIISLQHMKIAHWFLTTLPIQYLGRNSFMLYLLHVPVFLGIGDRWRRSLGAIPPLTEKKWWDNKFYITDNGWGGLNVRWIAEWFSVLFICLFVAHLAASFIDEPCVRLSKRMVDRLKLKRVIRKKAGRL